MEMSEEHFEYIWQFLRENNRSGVDNIAAEMICCICQRLLIDPLIASCGCRYCAACVTGYLNGEKRFCPGSGDICKKELLSPLSPGQPDYATSVEISNLTVKCPRNVCKFRGNLRNMEEHQRCCKIQTLSCPYGDIGCQERQLINHGINAHLVDGNESHARLLMECIGSLQNEMGSMKRDLADSRLQREELQLVMEQRLEEVKHLNQRVQSVGDAIKSIKTNNKSIQDDNMMIKDENKLIKEENKYLKEETIRLKSQLATMRSDYSGLFEQMKQQMREMRVQVESQASEIRQFWNKSRRGEKRMRELECRTVNERNEQQRYIDEIAVWNEWCSQPVVKEEDIAKGDGICKRVLMAPFWLVMMSLRWVYRHLIISLCGLFLIISVLTGKIDKSVIDLQQLR